MVKKTEEIKLKLIRAYAETGMLTASARICGISPMSLHRWINASISDEEDGVENSEWLVTVEGVEDWFHLQLKTHLAAKVSNAESRLVQEASEGHWQDKYFQGRRVWALDPKFIGWTDEEMKQFGYEPSARYLRDSEGNAIPEREYVPPALETVQAVLAAYDPDRWGKKSSVSVQQQIAGGVMVMHAVQPPQQQPQLPASAPAPKLAKPMAQIEVLPDEVLGEIVEDIEPDLAPDPLGDDLALEPVPVTPTPPPGAPVDMAARRATTPGVSELQKLANMSPEERQAAAIARNARR